MEKLPAIDQEQEERLKVLKAELKKPEFAAKFLACDTPDQAHQVCVVDKLSVTKQDVELVLGCAASIMNEDALGEVSGGGPGEKAKAWFKRHAAEVALGVATLYETVTSVISAATDGEHDYSMHKGIGALFEAAKDKFGKSDLTTPLGD